MLAAQVRFGTAGWDYPDWFGKAYPKPKPKGFDPLRYLAEYFQTVEINSTFYRPATSKVAQSWAKRVEDHPDFRFTAKLYKRFTHERAQVWTKEEVREVRDGFDVLLESGKLGAVLLQFPWSFRNDEANREWLRDLTKAFAAYPLAVEVRHDRVRLEAELQQSGHLVLADTYDPGWKATVDGRRADVLRANGAFRAVHLDAGRHVVEMVYRPASVLAGALVSAVAVLLGGAVVVARAVGAAA